MPRRTQTMPNFWKKDNFSRNFQAASRMVMRGNEAATGATIEARLVVTPSLKKKSPPMSQAAMARKPHHGSRAGRGEFKNRGADKNIAAVNRKANNRITKTGKNQ